MTGAYPPRMTRARPAGSWRIISQVMTGWRVCRSSPCSRMAAVPQSVEAASRVAGSEMPGSQILAPEVSMMTRAPSRPQRARNCASPCATVMIWMPLPPESASQGGIGQERQRAAHGHPDRLRGLVRLAAQFRELRGPLLAGSGIAVEDFLGVGAARAGDPAGDVPQVELGEGAGVEVGAQVIGGLTGPEGGVLDAFLADRGGERVGPADRGRRILTAVQRVPPERGRHVADVLRVEDVHRAAAGPDTRRQLEHVMLGGGGDHRAWVAQD